MVSGNASESEALLLSCSRINESKFSGLSIVRNAFCLLVCRCRRATIPIIVLVGLRIYPVTACKVIWKPCLNPFHRMPSRHGGYLINSFECFENWVSWKCGQARFNEAKLLVAIQNSGWGALTLGRRPPASALVGIAGGRASRPLRLSCAALHGTPSSLLAYLLRRTCAPTSRARRLLRVPCGASRRARPPSATRAAQRSCPLGRTP